MLEIFLYCLFGIRFRFSSSVKWLMFSYEPKIHARNIVKMIKFILRYLYFVAFGQRFSTPIAYEGQLQGNIVPRHPTSQKRCSPECQGADQATDRHKWSAQDATSA